MSSLPLEQPDFSLEILDFLGQEFDKILEVLTFLVQLILLRGVIVFLF